MGRPPLGHVVITVRLPRRAIERIDAVAPGNQRARFIREAVEAELERREATAAGR